MKPLHIIDREEIRKHHLADEGGLVRRLADRAELDAGRRAAIASQAAELVRRVRRDVRPSLMESFLAEYGLSTKEGVGLMCLAEALLRVPDAETIDELISDKIEPSDWGAHLGHSSSSMVNAATWALMLTGKVLDDDPQGPAAAIRGLVRRLGEPVVRGAVVQAMSILGRQFVLGETIGQALDRARELERKGYTYSYDMLGEAARTEPDAQRYMAAYRKAIEASGKRATGDVRSSPGISVKLSALHPRYEFSQRDRVNGELVPRALDLARLARTHGIGLNIDAEEADRIELSLDVIECILADGALAGWNGFGVVVQAYGKRALPVIDGLHELARRLDRKIMIRLVKGAYWDSEIKHAQELGLDGFPVFTRKANTDVSYLGCARRLLDLNDRIYPQFATHNAHTVAAILEMADAEADFEFQRLHGMGEALHGLVMTDHGTRCRIYAPVGAHRDLLAYLVRRLLENGANSSFVNQLVDSSVPPERIAGDPIAMVLDEDLVAPNPAIRRPPDLYEPLRSNSQGWNPSEPASVLGLLSTRERFKGHRWTAAPTVAGGEVSGGGREIRNPAVPDDVVGTVIDGDTGTVERGFEAAESGFRSWSSISAGERAAALCRAADLYEENACEIFALVAREAGKSVADSIAELREAADFLRYYASEIERLDARGATQPRGIFVCISPWNFPLAIFTGQVAAALAAGNAVIAKPAEQTPLVAARAVALMHEAGIPEAALQLVPGDGPTVGAALTSHPRLDGVCFTGSTEVARLINRAVARNARPEAAVIAETGGLNAMIVDSTALPEQAVRDILSSAFQSAGQRCSALRMLYIQNDVFDRVTEMLFGAMDELQLGDPWDLSTDVGPVIDEEAYGGIQAYCEGMAAEGRLLKRLAAPDDGLFVPPTVIRVSGIAEMEREVFGPVLHVASFASGDIEAVLDAINDRGYGLTFGLHSRIDDRVQQVVDRIRAGNRYVNRNQIGAIVASQPFGGEGLSGTGPKAGGPHYVPRFLAAQPSARESPLPTGSGIEAARAQASLDRLDSTSWASRGDRLSVLREAFAAIDDPEIAAALAACTRLETGPQEMPGPTGESNVLSLHPRGPAICLGPRPETAVAQAVQALAAGSAVLIVAPGIGSFADLLHGGEWPLAWLDGVLPPEALGKLERFSLVAFAGEPSQMRALRVALADREGEIITLVGEVVAPIRYHVERHLCIDTTAAGGNASLLAAAV